MTTQTDLRQIRSRDTLDRITGAADSKADLIVRNLNSEITPPLAFSVTGTDKILTIGNIVKANPTTGLNRTIPPISNTLPTFSSATVTLGAAGTNNATPSTGSAIALGMIASQFLKIGVNVDATGTLTLTSGTPASSLAAATTPATVSGLFAIGYFVARTNASNVVQNVLATDLYQYVGGGGGNGSGTGNPTLESIKNTFVDSPYELVTPNIITTDGQTKIQTLTGATYDLVTSTIKFTANSQVVLSTQLLDSIEFLRRGLDITDVDVSVYWNQGSSLQTLVVPPAAITYSNLAASTVTVGLSPVLVTTPTPHHLTTGARISVTTSTPIGGMFAGGLSQTNVAITVLSDTTFTYSSGVGAGSIGSGTLDTVAVLGFLYEISRDGGNNWFTNQMLAVGTTNVFRGRVVFDQTATTEATKALLFSQLTQDSTITFDTGSLQALGNGFVVTATTKLQEVILMLSKSSGTPAGTITVSIIKTSGGSPSTSTSDIVSQTNAISLPGLSLTTTPTEYTFDIPDVVLVPGTYHIVATTDAAYKAAYTTSATNSVSLGSKVTGASPFSDTFNGSTWNHGSSNLRFKINGRNLDLRLRISSPTTGSITYPCGLDGWGVFYNPQSLAVVGAVRKTARRVFNSITDNTNVFTIGEFSPDPDLLNVYHVETGQIYKSGAFALAGNVVTFPASTFNNGGVSQSVTLIFDQNNGSSFDNSDSNRRLMAANHLGSTNGADDTSLAGRGIILRNAAGTLVEIAVDASNNITVSTVP